jgi:hypothetical protein
MNKLAFDSFIKELVKMGAPAGIVPMNLAGMTAQRAAEAIAKTLQKPKALVESTGSLLSKIKAKVKK